MGYSDFSKKELTDILDAIQASIMCKTEADIVNVITKVKDMLCADHAVCGMPDLDYLEKNVVPYVAEIFGLFPDLDSYLTA